MSFHFKKAHKNIRLLGHLKILLPTGIKKHMACCLPRTSGKWEGSISNFSWREDSDKGSQSSLTGHAAPQGAVNSHKLMIAIIGMFSLSFLVKIQQALAVQVTSCIVINSMGNSNTVLRALPGLNTRQSFPKQLQPLWDPGKTQKLSFFSDFS